MVPSVSLLTRSTVLLRVLFSGALTTVAALNERPVIGVLTEQMYGKNESLIVSSYVKFLECAGARVAPILSFSSEKELTNIFNSVNGVLFPGGAVNLNTSHYGHAGSFLIKLAKEANDRGDYFPLWGTCLGFELLMFEQAEQNYSMITKMDAENILLPLKFTKYVNTSRLFSGFPGELLKWLREQKSTFNNHRFGVTLEIFKASPELDQFYTVLSTSEDRNGVEFVSSVEGKRYPFYGVQWHPEKNSFEWSTRETISHSQQAVATTQATANFFVSEARRNYHKFPSVEEERQSLIYTHTPVYTGDMSDFEQIYLFYPN